MTDNFPTKSVAVVGVSVAVGAACILLAWPFAAALCGVLCLAAAGRGLERDE